jgi:hypothetical protein
MVTEVQFIGSPGECLHCLLCELNFVSVRTIKG